MGWNEITEHPEDYQEKWKVNIKSDEGLGRALSFISTTGRNSSAAAGAVCGRDHPPVVFIS